MALKTVTQFPLFAPPQLNPQTHRTPTEIRFSRWNNANADKFIRHERAQKELEDQLRFQKRFDSALSITRNYNPAPPYPTTFKSTGTPSSPSSPSIPGKSSKYAKSPKHSPHPAFESLSKPRKVPIKENESQAARGPNFRIDENGISYEMPEAPFLYQYSYTETPKAKPVKLREPLVSPFGPESMAKPWMGRKPLPPSKKKLPEFDSFHLPPPHKKGVKPVQAPGPFLPGSGPKYVKSREEILGEPLKKEEIDALIQGCKKSDRQLNIGRDGLTHNMLDNIHAHWKRRRVCKIKCKGVCTVDMNNVCQQLEEKTGGKIIYSRGGVTYLFRGRNYNYKSRPRFPLMLWKPVSPVYPRLIQRVPEGLTLQEAIEMRKKGRGLTPICKLAKNGVYCDLVKNVREAFEACELVRINCQGLNASDYRKIGAKLKDLVPCVLISFEYEHILIWRGREWRSSLTEPEERPQGLKEVEDDKVALGSLAPPSLINVPSLLIVDTNSNNLKPCSSLNYSNGESQGNGELTEVGTDDTLSSVPDMLILPSRPISTCESIEGSDKSAVCANDSVNPSEVLDQSVESRILLDGSVESETRQGNSDCSETLLEFSSTVPQTQDQLNDKMNADELDRSVESRTVLDGSVESETRQGNTDCSETLLEFSSTVPQTQDQLNDKMIADELRFTTPWTEGVLLLKKQAVENGMAIVLDYNHSLDADTVFKKTVEFAKTAPTGPVFRRRQPQQLTVEKVNEKGGDNSESKEAPAVIGTEITVSGRRQERKTPRSEKMKDLKAEYLNVVPQGELRVDELAKLLA